MFRKPVGRAVQGDRCACTPVLQPPLAGDLTRWSTPPPSPCGSVAMLVPGLEAKDLERGVVASPGTLRELESAVVLVRKVKYHKARPRTQPPPLLSLPLLLLLTRGAQDAVKSGAKFHVTAGHTTTMATATFFGNPILPVRAPPRHLPASLHLPGLTRACCRDGRSGGWSSKGTAVRHRAPTATEQEEPAWPLHRHRPALLPLALLPLRGLRSLCWRCTLP